MTKEERKAYMKSWYEANRESQKVKMKAWRESNKEEHNASMKAWFKSHKEEQKAYKKEYSQAHKEEQKAYQKDDVNSLGQTKSYIRCSSNYILKQMNLKLPGYEIHHCFGYEDPAKFIYISKSLHLKIHQYLRDNNIDAGKDHWMSIRDIINSADEFTYIKC